MSQITLLGQKYSIEQKTVVAPSRAGAAVRLLSSAIILASASMSVPTSFANAQTVIETNPTDAEAIPTIQPALDNQEEAEILSGAALRSNIRAGEVEPGDRPVVEDDPFAPIGIPIGSLRLDTYFKQSVGYTTNRQRVASGDAGVFSLSEVDLRLRSDWSRHQLEINANGEYETYFDSQINPDTQLDITGNLRLDLIDGYEVTLGGNYAFENESASSPNLTDIVTNQPGVHNYGAFVQLERTGQSIGFALRGGIERSSHDDADLSNGGALSQADRDYVSYQLGARLAYNSGLALSPFVEASYTKSVYDLEVDRNGEQRDSNTYELRGGIAIDLGEKIYGEISLGYASEEFIDPGLAALAGFVVDANLNWSPQRDTNIALVLGSDFGGSTTAGDSGAITYEGTLSYTRRIRANLEFRAELGFEHTDYEGLERVDTTYVAEVGFEHWINRAISVTGELKYENLVSNETATSYDATSVMLGLKFQR